MFFPVHALPQKATFAISPEKLSAPNCLQIHFMPKRAKVFLFHLVVVGIVAPAAPEVKICTPRAAAEISFHLI